MLGEAPHLRRADVSEQSGVPPDVARARWRALGFPEADDDDVAFTKADVEALRLTQELIGLGVIEPETEQAFIRTIGRRSPGSPSGRSVPSWARWPPDRQDDIAAGDLAELEKVRPAR